VACIGLQHHEHQVQEQVILQVPEAPLASTKQLLCVREVQRGESTDSIDLEEHHPMVVVEEEGLDAMEEGVEVASALFQPWPPSAWR